MKDRTHRDALAMLLMPLALATAGNAHAAAASAAAARDESNDAELTEVLVIARRSGDDRKDPQVYFNWLSRLVGEFTVDGYVDAKAVGGARDLLTAEGTAKCIGFGVAPGVQCDLHVSWPARAAAAGSEIPGVAPTLDPAAMLFGFRETYQIGGYEYSINHVLIDNRGTFESGNAFSDGEDTMVSTSHCSAVRVDCERTVRITAAPDLRTVDMLIELAIGQQEKVRYVLQMSRVPGTNAQVYGREPEREERK